MRGPIAVYRQIRAELQQESVSAATCHRLLAGFDAWEAGRDLAEGFGLVADPAKYSRNGRFGLRLADRDEALRTLATRATGSPWRRAQTIAGWLTRHASGDRLTELPESTVDLLAVVGHLGARQIHRVLSGNRSA